MMLSRFHVFLAMAMVLARRRVDPTSLTIENATEPTVRLVKKGQKTRRMDWAQAPPWLLAKLAAGMLMFLGVP